MAALCDQLVGLMKRECWKEAVAVAESHPEAVHASFEMSWNAGWALFRLDRLEEALAHFERAQELDSSSPVAPWALGIALVELGELERAEPQLIRSVELKSGHFNRMSLALLYMRTGRIEDAERIHLEGLREKRTRQRLENYAAFLGDAGRDTEEQEVLAEAAAARAEGKRPA